MKNIMLLLSAFVVLGEVQKIHAKVYTRCGLTRELLNTGFTRTFVGHWVCLIESESGKNTSRVVHKANGSKGMGLFQINSRNWCKFGGPGGRCQMKCEDLINENIIDDASCARKVEKELGFRAWKGWMRSCYGRSGDYPSRIANTCLPY